MLRAEKGYVIIGQETDGTVGPDDLGLSWAIASKKPDFVGKRSLARPDMQRANRKQLVGLMPTKHVPEGSQLTATANDTAMLGHVTSSYWSPTLDQPFALALLESGRSRIGETVHARFGEASVSARVVAPVFYDSDGTRMNG